MIWKSPIYLKNTDVVTVPLSNEEYQTISEYADEYFPKEVMNRNVELYKPFWNFGKGRNPNEIGIRGEWACQKYFKHKSSLTQFLKNRPWRMSDMGDFALTGKHDTLIFDCKTRTRSQSSLELVLGDHWLAELGGKFSTSKYDYLQGFIFCTNDAEAQTIRITGWMFRDEYIREAYLVKANTHLPDRKFGYDNDCYVLPYRRLHPMSELQRCKYKAITEPMSRVMRKDFQHGRYKGISGYLA